MIFQLLPTFISLLGLIFIYKLLGQKGLIYLVIQPVIMFLIHLLNSSLLVYVASICFIFMSAFKEPYNFEFLLPTVYEDFTKHFLGHVSFAWINLRCMSFCLDRIWNDVPRSGSMFQELIHMLSYCFYLPIAVGGPVINYKAFYDGVRKKRLLHQFYEWHILLLLLVEIWIFSMDKRKIVVSWCAFG